MAARLLEMSARTLRTDAVGKRRPAPQQRPQPLGRQGALSAELLERRNSFGLLSEDIHPESGALWGNFPQTYSMAGIVNVATRLSERWEDVWCRVSS
jgi:hypothetical protein